MQGGLQGRRPILLWADHALSPRLLEISFGMKTRRAGSYKAAIQWIADEDDNEWLDDPDGSPSVTISLVADVFGRTIQEATEDLRKEIKNANQNR